jgi:hypothetical protein
VRMRVQISSSSRTAISGPGTWNPVEDVGVGIEGTLNSAELEELALSRKSHFQRHGVSWSGEAPLRLYYTVWMSGT